MGSPDVTQVRVGRHMTGIVGLKQNLAQVAGRREGLTDTQIVEMLLQSLSQSNYIPDNIRDLYAQAFLREFKSFIGEAVTEAPLEGMDIKVLGRGCPQCDRLEHEVMAVLADMRVEAALDHVRDVAQIGRFGVLGMPALVINGKVVCVGSVPTRDQIRAWIEQAAMQNGSRQ
jgi:hypothetical protein